MYIKTSNSYITKINGIKYLFYLFIYLFPEYNYTCRCIPLGSGILIHNILQIFILHTIVPRNVRLKIRFFFNN